MHNTEFQLMHKFTISNRYSRHVTVDATVDKQGRVIVEFQADKNCPQIF